MQRLLRHFRTLTRVALLVTLLPLTARAADYTDLWWTPAEPGWGVNVIQSDTFMFLTFFIYGADNKPTWYSAQLSPDAQGAYSGGLYLTAGTYYANPWNTADSVPAQQVGTAQFRPNATNFHQATLTYVVTGVGTVVKAIERQALTTIALGGSYTGGLAGVQLGCNGGAYRRNYDLAVTQASGVVTLDFTFPTYSCRLMGTLEQHGSLYTVPSAQYTCSNGFAATATLPELKATAQGIEGQWTAPLGGGCSENAYFSAVLL